jgi:putative PIN family toxin of toxin-antitoxin system
VTHGRVVLDTNVVVSALLFTSGRLAWLRHAWQREALIPLVCSETVAELVRVLGYPKLHLDADEVGDLLADFLSFAEIVELPDPWPEVPECRDPHDRVFLALALVGHADALVTGDGDLLAIGRLGSIPILTPEAFRQPTLGGDDPAR